LAKIITPVFVIQGPGAYNPDSEILHESEPKWKIPSCSRDQPNDIEKFKVNIPGPGAYNIVN
jgi:hypothetical protein